MSEQQRVVAILGTAPSSRHMANEQPPEVEVWALNDCWSFLQRPWQRWFEIHGVDMWKADGEQHESFLKTGQSPVQEKCVAAPGAQIYMLAQHPDIPMSVEYPMDKIKEEFGKGNNPEDPYLMSTIDYMLALAIHEGVDEIRIYGINMSTETEFVHQRPSCEYWMGIAQGRGIKIVIPDHCPMLQGRLYGPSKRGYLDKHKLVTRKHRMDYQMSEVRAQMGAMDGAVQALEKVMQEFGAIAESGVALPEEYSQKMEELHKLSVRRRYEAEMQVQATHGAQQMINQLIDLVDSPVMPDEHVEVPSTQRTHDRAVTAANGHNALEADHIKTPG